VSKEKSMHTLSDFLNASQARHTHLCPRQVLGVRIALAGLSLLQMGPTQKRLRNLLVISETDGCFVDGIEVAAGVTVGHRSLRIADYGKIAATFINRRTGQAIRLHPSLEVRELAQKYCPDEKRPYFAQLKGYQIIPDCELLRVKWVTLDPDFRQILGSPSQRTCCAKCGEEIINGREIMQSGIPLCVACAGNAYYRMGEETDALENERQPIGILSEAVA
jgi:formylmethanofuran dehydrogenase subunit E